MHLSIHLLCSHANIYSSIYSSNNNGTVTVWNNHCEIAILLSQIQSKELFLHFPSVFIFIFFIDMGQAENLRMILPDHIMQHCHLEANRHLSSLLSFVAHITLLVQTNIKIFKWPIEVILVFWHTNGHIVLSSFL